MKDPIVGIDSLGEPIYKALRLHRSMARLVEYSLCDHYCIECFTKWTHKTVPNFLCHLYWVHNFCENCLTYNFNASKKDKLAGFTDSQRKAVINWAQKHGVKIT
jgi:hypothetical protein